MGGGATILAILGGGVLFTIVIAAALLVIRRADRRVFGACRHHRFRATMAAALAGLRTNALVSVGAAGFVVFSMTVSADSSPTRVAAQIVSGIGFLGAGVILREGINIRGLNTAATLWCSAMVGTFAGAGQLIASVIATAFVLLTNLFLRPLVRLINRQPLGAIEIETHYSVELVCRGQQEAHIRALLLQAAASAGLGLRRLTSENLEDSPQVTVSALLVSASRNDAALEQIIGRMNTQ
jgi:putative Mg2+ transporter-C (MgtC) family protein